jgi:hypothetical protein
VEQPRTTETAFPGSDENSGDHGSQGTTRGRTTAIDEEILRGPRGGLYHISKGGNKEYEGKKKKKKQEYLDLQFVGVGHQQLGSGGQLDAKCASR